MKTFIRNVLSENGEPSSKRVAFFIVLFFYLGYAAVNVFYGKVMSEALRSDISITLWALLAGITGVNLYGKYTDMKQAISGKDPAPNNPPNQ